MCGLHAGAVVLDRPCGNVSCQLYLPSPVVLFGQLHLQCWLLCGQHDRHRQLYHLPSRHLLHCQQYSLLSLWCWEVFHCFWSCHCCYLSELRSRLLLHWPRLRLSRQLHPMCCWLVCSHLWCYNMPELCCWQIFFSRGFSVHCMCCWVLCDRCGNARHSRCMWHGGRE